MPSAPLTPSQESDYVRELATLFPAQGNWPEAEYVELTDHANRRIEFTDGQLEFLPMLTLVHETLVRFLFLALYHFVDSKKLGEVFSNGIRVRVRPDKIRLPDVLFLHRDHYHVRHSRVWDGADLVMEVISDASKDRRRDYETKLADYAEAGISEYWIIDYQRKRVIVHGLDQGSYTVGNEYSPGQRAASELLDGFSVDVSVLFASADDVPE